MGNDTLATLAAGGLVPVKSTEIALESEDLDLSLHQVRVRYTFRNASDHDIEAVVAFPLPEIDGVGVFYVPMVLPLSRSINFMDFRVEQLWPSPGSGSASWKRTPVATETEVRAFLEDKDITDELSRLGLPVSVLDPRMDSAISALPPQTREALLKNETIGMEETTGPDKTKRQMYYPGWSTRVQFYWKQRFPSHAVTVLEQTYVPVVGGGYIVKNGSETKDLAPFCVTPHQRENIEEQVARSPATYDGSPVLLEREIKYILTTANNWSGPIEEFRLSIRTDSPTEIVLTCTPGLAQVSPSEYRLMRSNFRPDRELDLLIIEKNK